jgi:hypothetical protein
MSNEKREIIKEIIEYYGEPTDKGCYVNGQWLSVEKIIEIIELARI